MLHWINQLTAVGWGTQVHRLVKAAEKLEEETGIKCEVIDLQTVLPFDVETIMKSVAKTGRLLVSHEAPVRAFGSVSYFKCNLQ